MITKQEYLDAIKTIEEYKKQITNEYNKVVNDIEKLDIHNLKPITKDTLITEIGLPARALNGLYANLDHLGIDYDKWTMGKCSVTLNDFNGIRLIDLKRCRNVGKKSLEEIKVKFFEAGITIK